MNKITLQHALPAVFSGKDRIDSEVWHKDVEFERGHFYQIEAASGSIERASIEIDSREDVNDLYIMEFGFGIFIDKGNKGITCNHYS